MQATPDDLFAALGRLGIETRTLAHEAVFTVAQSRAVKEAIPGGHTKNLFLKDRKDGLFLVVAPAEAEIDLKRLHEAIGAAGRLSFGSAELLRAVLGVEPGSVTPFAAINDREGRVRVAVDAALMAEDPINVHPLANTMTTSIAPSDLVRFLERTGHPPLIVTLSAPGRGGAEEVAAEMGAAG